MRLWTDASSSFGAVVMMAAVVASPWIGLQMPASASISPSAAGPMAYGWRGDVVRSHS